MRGSSLQGTGASNVSIMQTTLFALADSLGFPLQSHLGKCFVNYKELGKPHHSEIFICYPG